MNKPKNYFVYSRITAVLLVLIILLAAGCTLDGLDDEINNSITDEDLEAASQILGESLSSDNSGLMLSLNDALTTASSDGFTRNSSNGAFQKNTGSSTQDDDSGRGNETNFSYSYDPETGVHTVSFTRKVDRPLFSKEVNDTLKYIFTDSEGAFIEFPRREKQRIESIDYTGYRKGSTDTPTKTSSFQRTDTLLINGVSSGSSILQIDGVHNGDGRFRAERSNGDFREPAYQLEINFLNIEIDKSIAQQGLEDGVTGTLTWQMTIKKNTNGNQSTKTLTGTIEMNGDGTALLRFRKFLKVFNINLDDGDVKDRDHEFEGRVTSVNLDRQSFTLRSGYEIFVNDQTEFDDDDYSSLHQVQDAIQNGTDVWAEGEGYRENNHFIATEVEFEREEVGDENDADDTQEFEASVTSVKVELGTFTLAGEVIVKIDEQTSIDSSGDYQSLQEVNDALTQGSSVVAEGEAVVLGDASDAALRAIDVKFESDQGDSSDNDSEED